MSDLEAADARARERALDVTESFIVQAPAGSGKTTVLTQRYLRLLTTVDEPEQVLAITFTRKAAGEMRERVQKALDGDIEVRTPSDALTLELAARVRTHAARREWGIEDSAARLRIQTIDAFNGYLANSLPVTSQNGFGRAIADEPDDLYAAAARETLRHAESDPELQKDFELILRRLDDSWQRLEGLIAGMLPRRAEWLPNLPQLSGEALVPKIEASLAAMVADELAAATGVFPESFVELASALARFAAQHVDAADMADVASWRNAQAPLTRTLGDLARWRGVARLALTDEGTARKTLNKTDGIPADNPHGKALRDDWVERLRMIGAEQLAALNAIGTLPDPVVPEKARGALEALAELLLLAATQLTRLFNVHGECDHVEIAGAARRALTENSSPTPLAERIGTRLMHILVDEFQDTSRDQYELLRTLTQDWSAGDGRTLFLVGDPMQSIYGFRNAEVGRFSTVRAAGLAGLRLTPLELRRNFRSAPALVHWCNEVFARVFPLADDVRKSAVRHLASVAARTNLAGEPRIYRVAGDCGPAAEAERAADLIAALKREHPSESVAVLAGARSHLRDIRASLAKRGVPFLGIKLEPLADISIVRDLEALARALDSPLDRVAWLAVLRAPFVGLALADLTAVSETAGGAPILQALQAGIPGLSDDGAARLQRAVAVLADAWQQRERESRAHLVERCWLALGGASGYSDAGELAHARRFLAALDEVDRKRLRGRELDLTRLMTKLYAEDPAQPDAVSLMTIHGAKGLEFDHVFIVGVGLRGRGDAPRLLNWLEVPREEGGDHLVMAPIRFRGDDDEGGDDAINLYLKALHRERARAERARQAYVALTRAKRSLHLFVHPRARHTDGGREFVADAGSLLHNLWPAIGADVDAFETVGDEAGAESSIAPALAQTRKRSRRDAAQIAPPPDVLAQGDLATSVVEQDEIEFSWVRQTARRVGTVVHEALERFGSGGLPAPSALSRMRTRLESRLQALGVEAERASAGADRAMTALRATLEDETGRWLFDATHSEAQSELALSGVRGSQIVNVIIDRTFVTADGIRWVVDFKTSPHEGGDLSAFLDSEALRYTAQLTRYVHLARQLGPQPVRAGLYFPLLAAWREVDVG
jgi:ATP-dependent helicase/nuclease subunit A